MSPATHEAAHQVHQTIGVGLPVTVTGLTLLGIGLQEWVYILTIAVAVSQLVRFVVWCAVAFRKYRAKQP